MKMAGLRNFWFWIVKALVRAVELNGALWGLKRCLRDLPYVDIKCSSYLRCLLYLFYFFGGLCFVYSKHRM